ncbi:hypothetical protein ACOMHN_059316 [Nucella lapillus]
MFLRHVVCAVLVFWVMSFVTSDLVDFDDSNTIPGWEFIYHQEHDLLLTVSSESCHFSTLHEHYANRTLSTANRPATERVVYSLTKAGGSADPRPVPSSLGAQRQKYHDLLATYKCQQKHIYDLPLKAYHVTTSHPSSTSHLSHWNPFNFFRRWGYSYHYGK